MKHKHAAIFLDRDGTIIEDRGHISDINNVVFYPDCFAALKRLQEKFILVIVTNQMGIAEGIITMEEARSINNHVIKVLGEAGIEILDDYVCPHKRTQNCRCIKPKPYFLNLAAQQYQIDLHQSFTIGDHPHDVIMGDNVGATGIYLLTGHGRKHLSELPENALVATGIAQAAEMILQQTNQ